MLELFGVVYVFDELLVGFYLYDVIVLLGIFDGLKQCGNSFFVVEYFVDVMWYVDWLVDIGFGVGECGGCVIYSGFMDGFVEVDELVMCGYIFGGSGFLLYQFCVVYDWLQLEYVICNNLWDVFVVLLFGMFIVVIGVLGLGKFSFVS